MYRIEDGPSSDQRLQDRLDRMVAAIYPVMFGEEIRAAEARTYDRFDRKQWLYLAIQPAVSLAWQLLEAIDTQMSAPDAEIARAAQRKTKENP